MKRPIFENMDKKPPLVCSLSDRNVADTICTVRNALYDGADGFLLHMERLEPEAQNYNSLKEIFSYMEDRPVLTLNYRTANITDDDRVKLLFTSIEAGAACVDLMGDMFGSANGGNFTEDEAAVKKQIEVIEKVHEVGGQVMMSSHIWEYTPSAQVLIQAKKMEARGVDIVKIAMNIGSREQLMDGMRATVMMDDELKVPFLHILMGQYGKVHRVTAPTLGSCMVLCVQRYTPAGHKDKPLLRAVREIYNNLDYKMSR